MKLEVQPSQRSAVLELGLIINVRYSEAIDLDSTYDLLSSSFFNR